MQFFKKAGDAFHSRAGSFIFFALAAASFTFMCSSSWAYDWIAEIYPLGEKFVPTILSVIAACVVITFAYFILFSLKNTKSFSDKALFRISHTIFAVLTGILFVYTTVLLFGLDGGFQIVSIKNGFSSVIEYLPLFGVTVGLPFIFLIYPLQKKICRTVTALIICLAVIIPTLFAYLPDNIAAFAISANPLVLDIGGDNYSVVFATNRNSIAYLMYADENSEITLSETEQGRMHIGRVHNFTVPRDSLNAGSYRFITQEVISSINANTKYGEIIESPVFNFKGEYKDDLNILVASDWHDAPEKLLKASANFPQADLFVMMGDLASNYNSEDEFIINTIAAGADITKSEIPAIYVRGNHELYGEKTDIIFPGLGLESFYYQVQRGKYLFTVSDGGGGWDDSTSLAKEATSSAHDDGVYLSEELIWLEGLPAVTENTFHFSLLHIPGFNWDKDKRSRFYENMQRLETDIQFSAHEHILRLDMPNTGEFLPPYPMLIDGGPTNGYTGDYICSMAQVSAEGKLRLTAFNTKGEQLMDEILEIE